MDNYKQEILQLVEKKVIIPKPKSDNVFQIVGIGKRRNEDAIIYSIPNHKNELKPYHKGITFSELYTVISEIKNKGFITRAWFNMNLPKCAKEGSCNYTSLCGILELLGLVKYTENGTYVEAKK